MSMYSPSRRLPHRATVSGSQTDFFVILPNEQGDKILMANVHGKWALPELHIPGIPSCGTDVCQCDILIDFLSGLGIGSHFIYVRFVRSRLLKLRDFQRSICIPIVQAGAVREIDFISLERNKKRIRIAGGELRSRARRRGRLGNGAEEHYKGGGDASTTTGIGDADTEGYASGSAGGDANAGATASGNEARRPNSLSDKAIWVGREDLENLELAEPFGTHLAMRRRGKGDDGIGWEIQNWQGIGGEDEMGVDEQQVYGNYEMNGTTSALHQESTVPNGVISISRTASGREYRCVPIQNTNYCMRKILNEFFDTFTDGKLRDNIVPWFKRGWFEQAQQWIRDKMKDARNPITGQVVQIRSQNDCIVLRAETKSHHIFFKAVLTEPLQANEPALTKELMKWFPDLIPKVLAVDVKQRYMLMEDFGKPVFWYRDYQSASEFPSEWKHETHPDAMKRVIHSLFEVQIRCSRLVDRIEALQVPKFDSNNFETLIDQLFNDPLLDRIIDQEELVRLRTRVVHDLKAACRMLAKSKLPQTLVHGDFGFHNISLPSETKRGLMFFNWQEAVISHPFFDAINVLEGKSQEAYIEYMKLWERKRHTAFDDLDAAFSCAHALRSLVPAIKWMALYKSEQLEFKDSINEVLRARIRDLGCCYFPPMFDRR